MELPTDVLTLQELLRDRDAKATVLKTHLQQAASRLREYQDAISERVWDLESVCAQVLLPCRHGSVLTSLHTAAAACRTQKSFASTVWLPVVAREQWMNMPQSCLQYVLTALYMLCAVGSVCSTPPLLPPPPFPPPTLWGAVPTLPSFVALPHSSFQLRVALAKAVEAKVTLANAVRLHKREVEGLSAQLGEKKEQVQLSPVWK
jgi:hypothetical protein